MAKQARRTIDPQKKHYCHCGGESKPFQRQPGKKMFWACEAGHEVTKQETTLR